jgi:phage tail-like protein
MAGRKDPYRAYNFLVEIDGITRAGFRECSGLDSTQAPIEYREGGEIITVRKIPGLIAYSSIVLKWGISDDKDLWEWRLKTMEGKVERKNGSIILLDDTGTEKIRWNFREAWATKWTGGSFNATGNEVLIEQIDLAHEGTLRA